MCVRNCSDTAKPYIDPEDPDKPRCVDKCPKNYYLDEIT